MRTKPYIVISTFKKVGNVSATAKLLGISRMSVYRWSIWHNFCSKYPIQLAHRELASG